MSESHAPMVTASRLLRWTERVHAFEKNNKADESIVSPIRTWVFGPLRKAIGSIARFVLTVIAVLIRPKVLHTVSAGETNPFLGDRAFVLGAIGFYELLRGQFVYFAALEAISNPTIKSIAKTTASALGLLFLVGVVSVVFWVGARAAKASLRFQQSVKIASYSMGVIPVLQLLTALPVAGVLSFAPSALWVTSKLTMVFMLVAVIYFLHVTFVIPVSIVSPGSSKPRLWLGWWAGWLVGMSLMAGMLMLFWYFLPGQSVKVGFL